MDTKPTSDNSNVPLIDYALVEEQEKLIRKEIED